MRSKILAAIVLCIGIGITWISCSHQDDSKEPSLPDVVSYNFHIRPILSDKCFKCHGPDVNKRKAGLRLDIPDSAYAPLKETKGAFALFPVSRRNLNYTNVFPLPILLT